MHYSEEVKCSWYSVRLKIKHFNCPVLVVCLSVCLSVCLFFLFKAIVDRCANNTGAIINHTGEYSFRQLHYYVM